jgi:FlgD Ig-like domain
MAIDRDPGMALRLLAQMCALILILVAAFPTSRGASAALGPSAFQLLTIYPAPVSESVVYFRTYLPEDAQVVIRIYDLRGRLIATPVNSFEASGHVGFYWDRRTKDGVRIPSGVYIASLRAKGSVSSRKFVVAR